MTLSSQSFFEKAFDVSEFSGGIFSIQMVNSNATQAKERLYTQLAGSLGRMSRAIGRTADLCEQLQVDLHAMRIFAGLDAAK